MDIKQELSKQLTKINIATSTFLEEQKIKTYIATLEDEVRELKVKAGEIGFEMWQADQYDETAIFAVYEEIVAKCSLIEEQKTMIQALVEKNKQVLGDDEETPVEAEDLPETGSIFCTNCGTPGLPNARFCKKCGTKL